MPCRDKAGTEGADYTEEIAALKAKRRPARPSCWTALVQEEIASLEELAAQLNGLAA